MHYIIARLKYHTLSYQVCKVICYRNVEIHISSISRARLARAHLLYGDLTMNSPSIIHTHIHTYMHIHTYIAICVSVHIYDVYINKQIY